MALADCIGKPQMISYRNESFFSPSPSLVCDWLGPHTEVFPQPALLFNSFGAPDTLFTLPPLWSSAYCLNQCFSSAALRHGDQLRLSLSLVKTKTTAPNMEEGNEITRPQAEPGLGRHGNWFLVILLGSRWGQGWWRVQNTFTINFLELRTSSHVTVLKLSGFYWKRGNISISLTEK